MVSQEKNSLVVKSNRLIEASYRLSMVEMQLVLMSIMQARDAQNGFTYEKPVTIKALDFAKMFNLDSKSVYQQMRNALDGLFERYVMVDEVNAAGDYWVHKTRWISRVSYCDGEGAIKIIFAQDLIPYITTLEREFTSYRVQQIGHLSSVYAVRMYEFLIQFRSTGFRTFEIDRLRDMLGLVNEYQLFNHLKERVIDVAVEQINKHTDLKVSYKTHKTGRKITHLDFSIKEKTAANSKRAKLTKDFIDKHARAGETYEQAADRLRKERDQ